MFQLLWYNKYLFYLEKLIAGTVQKEDEDGLDTIAETDNEDGVDDEVSEGATGPITDDTATEDETVDHTQDSDDEGTIFFTVP